MISGQLFWFIEDFDKHLSERNQLHLLAYAHLLCLWVSRISLYHQTVLLRIFFSTTESLSDIFCYYQIFFYILLAWNLPFIRKYLRIQPITKSYHTDRNLLQKPQRIYSKYPNRILTSTLFLIFIFYFTQAAGAINWDLLNWVSLSVLGLKRQLPYTQECYDLL